MVFEEHIPTQLILPLAQERKSREVGVRMLQPEF